MGMSRYYVYELWDSQKNEVFYVGKGKYNRTNRLKEHIRESKLYLKLNKNGTYKVNKIKKLIKNNIEIVEKIIFETDDETEAFNKEKELIKYYGRKDNNTGILTNMTDGGDGGIDGIVLTEETREKLHRASSGKNNPMYGKTGELSPMFNKLHTIETKEKISNKNKNKIFNHSEEYKNNMKLSHFDLGRKTARAVYAIDDDGYIIDKFDSCKQADKKFVKNYNPRNGSVINELAFRKKHAKGYGYFWRFVDDYDPTEDFKKLNNERYIHGVGSPYKQIDPTTGNIIKIWNSKKMICEHFCVSSYILNKAVKNKTILFNYMWEKIPKIITKISNKKEKLKGRKIIQYDINMNIVKIWDDYKSLEKCGYTRSSIKNSNKFNRPRYGYYWKYIEKED
jgi:hypothetical protein